MNWRKSTIGLILTVTTIIIGYDIFIVIKSPGDTISNIMMTSLWRFPFVAYAWSVLLGHFLSLIKTKKRYIKALVIISSIVLLFSLLTVFNIIKVTALILFVISILGFIVGTLLWSIRRK